MMRMNPVYKKELKMTARSMQLPVLTVIFNSVLLIVVVITLYCIRQISINGGGSPYHSMMPFYMAIFTIELGLFCLFVPSAAGGSIAGERERQTLDILLASKMTIPGIIIGKLMSCISVAILLGVSSLPILAVVLMYGGIGLIDIYQSVIYVGFLVLLIGCIGVLCSCCFKKTTFASVASYGILIFMTLGTGILVVILNLAFQLRGESAVYGPGFASGISPVSWLVYLWLLNPAVTYIAVLFRQLGDMRGMEEFLQAYGAAPAAAEHWIVLSLVVQTIFILLTLVLSVKYLDPQNERFQAGGKILKKHKRR